MTANDDGSKKKVLITGGVDPDWEGFFGASGRDVPVWSMLGLVSLYWRAGRGVVLITGRPERYRVVTEDWLVRYRVRWSELLMRGDGDRRPDHVVKRDMVRGMDRGKVLFALDDRVGNVRMYREMGIDALLVGLGGV